VSWGAYTLDQLGYVGRGRSRHRPRNDPKLYGGETPFIQTADIQSALVRISSYSQTYSEEGVAQSKVWDQPTLCLTIAGENTGSTAILDFPACFPDSIVGFVPDPEKADLIFVKHALDAMRSQFRMVSKGATQDNLSLVKILSFPLRVPSLPVQRKIASIVGGYDDLIENNRRRIALLEEASRLLYREWFVHFRFPGHEHVKIIDGLPEGWEQKPISELAEIFRGKSYSSEELVEEGGQPFVNLKCIQRFGGFRVSGLKGFRGEHKPQHLLFPGDIVIAVTDMTREAMIVAQAARIPRTVGEDAIYSMDLVKAAPKEGVEPNWIYGLLRFSRFSAEVREEATGATVLHLKPTHIESWIATVPNTLLRGLFAEQFGAILEQIDNLELQSEKLAQARDLLLPRLMNGEIAV
jgi:type I restriction enzyme, S subunit